MTEIIVKAINISTPVSAKMRGLWEEASLGLRLVRVLHPKFQFQKDGLCGPLACTAVGWKHRKGRAPKSDT